MEKLARYHDVACRSFRLSGLNQTQPVPSMHHPALGSDRNRDVMPSTRTENVFNNNLITYI